MPEVISRQFSMLITLSLVLGLTIPQYPTTNIPETERWDKSGVPLRVLSVPKLTPSSTFKLQGIHPDGAEQIENIAVIDDVFIALTQSAQPDRQRPRYRLRAFDITTGEPLSSLDVPFPVVPYNGLPNIYASSRESVVLELGEFLVEYDKSLKLRGKINLPKGRAVQQAPAYGYGDWATVTATECKAPIAAFYLNTANELVTACDSEMGVLDQDGKLIFAERYKRQRIADPQIASDGKRFLFFVLDPFMGGDPPPSPNKNPPDYVLYDLRGDGPRRISFSTAPQGLPFEATALSADGRTLALYSANKISFYRLPE
jgi:hypothetical protein